MPFSYWCLTDITNIDLGLSSGTKWKSSNEQNAADAEYAFFTYDEAVSQFGDKLPSRQQFMELVNECEWSWTGMGYKIVGPSGKSISLLAAGCRDCSGGVYGVGSGGYYWSSTPSGSELAWLLYFYHELRDRKYKPSPSVCFVVQDSVKREVFASEFRDRVVHHLYFGT